MCIVHFVNEITHIVRFLYISPLLITIIALQVCLHFDRGTVLPNYLLLNFGMAKRNELSLDQKVRVLEALETRNQIQVASEFGISQSAVSRIKSRENDIIQRWQEMPDRKRARRTRCSDMLDVALVRFYESQRVAGIPVTTKMLKERAALVADESKISGSEAGIVTSQGRNFEASDSWLSRWKHRHNLDLQRSNSSAEYFVGSKKSSMFSTVSQFKEIVDEEGNLVIGGELAWNII